MGRTKKTIEKEPEPLEQRPYWKDENRISAAWRLATANCKHLNAVICPLCEHCGIPITEERTLAYIGRIEDVEADYIANVKEQTAGVTDFLAGPIEQEARQRFKSFVDGLSGAIKRNPAKQKESYYRLGGLNEVTLDEVTDAIKLQGQYFGVDYATIESHYTNYLSDADIAKYERQKVAAKALNDFFRGNADIYAFNGAFYFSGGEVHPTTNFNYKLIR